MKVAIIGAYQTKFGELWDKSLADLIFEASVGALADSRMPAKKIQIAFFGNKLGPQTTSQNHLSALVAQLLGVSIPVIRVEAACASGGVALSQACLAIESGQYDTALVLGAEKMTDQSPAQIAQALMGAASSQEREAGLTFPGLYALMAGKYLNDFGAKETDLAGVSVKNHFHASLNSKAQFQFPVTIDQVMKSGEVASPLKLLDCSPITDGAAGLVLASPRFAQKRQKKNIYIRASQHFTDTLSLSKRQSFTEIPSAKKAAKKAFIQAGVEPSEVSLAEVHDCFTIAEILALEDLGFYQKGEGFLAVRNGQVKLGGTRPVNLSGGLKACGHPVGATGVKQVVELYNQLLGRAGKKQTRKAKVGLAHNIGGTGGTAVVHIITK